MTYLLDTNVCIDYLTGRFPSVAVRLRALGPADVCLSSIVVAELYAGVRGGSGDAEQIVLEKLLALFRVVSVSADIGRLGGLYRRDYGRSHGVGLGDAIIAATATVEDAALKTLNVRHYPMFPGLEPAYRKHAGS